MQIYLVDDIDLIPKVKRLIKLKANLGLCEWFKDLGNHDINIQEIVDAVEEELEIVKENSTLLKVLSDAEDTEYFNFINSFGHADKFLEVGVVDNNVKKLISGGCPIIIAEAIERVSETNFIWIV